MNQNYTCPYCQKVLLLSNKMLHDLRCPGRNQSNSNNIALRQNSNFNNNRNNNLIQNNNQNYFNNMNNIISTNSNSMMNPDGTKTQITIETYQNGYQRII